MQAIFNKATGVSAVTSSSAEAQIRDQGTEREISKM